MDLAFGAYAIESLLAVLLTIAATAKVHDSQNLENALRVGGVTGSALTFLKAAIPLLEVLIAGSLITGTSGSVRGALFAASAMFATFTTWIVYMLARGLRPTCGCFGPASESLSFKSVLRNLILLALSVTALGLARRAGSALLPFSLASLIAVSAGLSIVGLLVSLYLVAPRLVLSREQSEGRSG